MPVISENTYQRLLEELGLDQSPKTASIISGISGETPPDPSKLVLSNANSVFGDLVTINRSLIETINDEFNRANPGSYWINYCVIGMAIVLKAFDIESQDRLILRFGNLSPEDLDTVRMTLQKSLIPNNNSILEKLLTAPRIPEQQIALNQVLNSPRLGVDTKIAKEGAGLMYNILGRLWPKLYPPPAPNQPPIYPD